MTTKNLKVLISGVPIIMSLSS